MGVMKEKVLVILCLLGLAVGVATGIITVAQAVEIARQLVELVAHVLEIAQVG
jgi:hypothetical protein